ncbi:MAG: hypothetical protein NTZ59_12545 [Bacteroidetes bacterium]|nr:hypothetical protein [Bacteroidota bacterium]
MNYDSDYKLNNIPKSYVSDDQQFVKIVRITRAFKNNVRNILIRYISQYRMDYPDFEFDYEIYIAKMHIINNKYENAEKIFKLIRKTMFLRLAGIQYIKKRIETNKDIGTLDIISLDVLHNIVIT